MQISACVITKDEEKNIAACLASVKAVATEMIVVDTGSADSTVAVAQQAGATIFHYRWRDDFSAARNFAIAKARGKWIIFLDADEYFTPETRQNLVGVIRQAEQSKAAAIFGMLANYDTTENTLMSRMKCIRIFKNDGSLHYRGAIHESLVDKTGQGTKVFDATASVNIIHTGYTLAEWVGKNKLERNMNLLLGELKKNPRDSTTCFYIAETLQGTDLPQALAYGRKVLEFRNAALPGLYEKNYLNLLRWMAGLSYPLQERLVLADRALAEFPAVPDFYFCRGELLAAQGRVRDAIAVYEAGIERLGDAQNVESDLWRTLAQQLHNLGLLYIAAKETSRAVKAFVEAVKSDRYHFAATVQLMRLLCGAAGTGEVWGFLQKLYDYDSAKDIGYLLLSAIRAGEAGLGERYYALLTPQQQERTRREAAILAAMGGRYADAAALGRELPISEAAGGEERGLWDEGTAGSYLAILLISGATEVPETLQRLCGAATVQKIFAGDNCLGAAERELLLMVAGAAVQMEKFADLAEAAPWIYAAGITRSCAEMAMREGQYGLAADLYLRFIKGERELAEGDLATLLAAMGECLYLQDENELALQFMLDAHGMGEESYRSYEIGLDILKNKGELHQGHPVLCSARQRFPESPYIQTVQQMAQAGNG